MSEFIAPSGVTVVINAAPWRDAKALKAALEKTLARDVNLNTSMDLTLSTILSIDSSPEIDAAIWPCLARCTRNKIKITEEVFDDLKAREDYYDIAIACIKENLRPLAESLFSKLTALGVLTKQASEAPKSPSKTKAPS